MKSPAIPNAKHGSTLVKRAVRLKKGEMKMQNTFTVCKRNKTYKDKETGAEKVMKLVVITFENGVELEVASGRFTYKAFDYLSEICEKGGN
jgi:phosphotransferase system HPr-like phosphotransfer protein